MKADIVIIGGGVTGSAIARELARYNLNIVLLEKEDDVAMGTSKANSGIIHAGYNADARTLKGKLNVKANPMFDKLTDDLKVPFKRIGSLVIGFNEKDLQVLKREKENGERLGVKGLEIIQGERLFVIEPNLNPDAKYALYAPTAGIISTYEFTIALADNAVINGVKVLLETEVVDLVAEGSKITGVKTNRGEIKTQVVINAAGLYSDKIAAMSGDDSINIRPRKGEYHLLDKNWGNFVNHVLFPIPSKVSKGILVTPTTHGNLLLGPNSQDVDERNDPATTVSGLDEVYSGARKLVPGLSRSDVITSFSGLRAVAEDEDFIIGPSNKVRGLIHVAGIQSPGLTSAPAIAELVVELVKEALGEVAPGKEIHLKEDFQETLPTPVIFNKDYETGNLEGWQKLVKEDPDYGEVICRCERVTKGEIIRAIHRPVPARSLDAIKRRTRAGAGRCQGGFCGPRVVEILSKELGISPLEVTKKGAGSEILKARSKELIRRAGDGDEI